MSPTGGATDFYSLGFASQMIVWAMRKRLHSLLRRQTETDVAEGFALVGFEDLHAALMSVVDRLLCGASTRIQLHAVACPCLSPHEVGLLNALAYLQRGRQAETAQCVRKLCCATAARFVQPALQAIVDDLD